MPLNDDEAPESSLTLESSKAHLESLAISVYMDLMTDSTVDPKVRRDAAGDVLRALGKDAPPKATGPQVVFNFGSGLRTALSGVGQLQELLARPAGSAIVGDSDDQ